MNEETFKANYEKYADVMFVDFTETPKHADVDTFELGEQVGFPGQIVVRFNAESGDVYGVIIERYSAVEKKLKREAAKRNAKQALKQLVELILEALEIIRPSMHLQLEHA
jgi:ribosome-associated translation inhibitor RaiA